MHDLYSKLLVESKAVPQTITASNVTTGDIDMHGFKSLLVVAHVGAIVDTLDESNKIDLKLEHADDDGTGSAGSYTACTDSDVLWDGTALSSGIYKTLDTDAEDSKVYAIGYRGGKRFVKATAIPTSIGTGGPIGLLALKGSPENSPVTQQT